MKKLIITLSAILAVIGIVFYAQDAKANRSYFVPTVQTSSATSSPDYMRAVNSTLILDAYAYDPSAIGSATLFIQSIASTSAAIQTVTITYSQDGVDWYQDNLATTTSSSIISLNNTQQTYRITGNATASTTRTAISVKTPTRYVRATVATSTALSSVWMQWIPVREMK